jgi:hypothetical protein
MNMNSSEMIYVNCNYALLLIPSPVITLHFLFLVSALAVAIACSLCRKGLDCLRHDSKVTIVWN